MITWSCTGCGASRSDFQIGTVLKMDQPPMPGIEHWDSEMACLSRECKATDCSNLVSICMIYPGAIGSGSYCGDNCQYKYWRAHPAAQETEFGMARILLREVGPFQPAGCRTTPVSCTAALAQKTDTAPGPESTCTRTARPFGHST